MAWLFKGVSPGLRTTGAAGGSTGLEGGRGAYVPSSCRSGVAPPTPLLVLDNPVGAFEPWFLRGFCGVSTGFLRGFYFGVISKRPEYANKNSLVKVE